MLLHSIDTQGQLPPPGGLFSTDASGVAKFTWPAPAEGIPLVPAIFGASPQVLPALGMAPSFSNVFGTDHATSTQSPSSTAGSTVGSESFTAPSTSTADGTDRSQSTERRSRRPSLLSRTMSGRLFSKEGGTDTPTPTKDAKVGAQEASHPAWATLVSLLESADFYLGSEAQGAAAAHAHAARQEAASKLIGNHARVLQDVTNPSVTTNIDLKPLTQLELTRVKPELRDHADECMREIARRLLGERAAVHQLEARLDPRDIKQCAAWIGTASYLDGRIQASPSEKPGRAPDLAPAAAAAMRAVLHEIKLEAVTRTLAWSTPRWSALHDLLDAHSDFAADASGAAAAHAARHREEAARKLISNHVLVLKDVCNPTKSDVQYGNPLTQLDLTRVAPENAFYADECLREIALRLLGRRPGGANFEARLNASNNAQLAAWMGVSAYMEKRIQSYPDEKPGRTPDMSPLAAEAMRAVLKDVGAAAINIRAVPRGSDRWTSLQALVDKGQALFETQADGIAASFAHHARWQAATKLLSNHVRVLQDLTNSSDSTNIDGKPLTQLELTRVDFEHAEHADAFLREVVRRLLGRLPSIQRLEEFLDPTDAEQCRAWHTAAKYLDGRIQFTTDQKPEREPDLSAIAATAMRAVLKEVGSACLKETIREGMAQWAALRKMSEASTPFGSEADGLMSAHAHAARQEAAKSLIANHARVLQDVTNPSATTNIDDKPLTQLELTRVDFEHAFFADQALREVVRRLLGRRQGSKQLEERVDPTNEAQVGAWSQTAVYLDGRIHSTAEEKPGRVPDMSSAAAHAMRDALKEIAFAGAHATAARTVVHWTSLHNMANSSKEKRVTITKEGNTPEALKEAAVALITNRVLVLKDLTNPTFMDVTHKVPLTQTELKRVAPAHVLCVDQFMREVVRRLLMHRGADNDHLRHRPEMHHASIWQDAATYLDGRMQATAEEKPGRKPDMSYAATSAMRSVLNELRDEIDDSGSFSRGGVSAKDLGKAFKRAGMFSLAFRRNTVSAPSPASKSKSAPGTPKSVTPTKIRMGR